MAQVPPETPNAPSGPAEGIVGISIDFTASTTDPDGDAIQYQFDWGDGTISGWYGPFASGTPATGSHSWATPGTYNRKVRAKDDNGSIETAWSASTSINILKDQF